ncbi:hypothetical protein NSQ20_03260 [Paenibacillus sp. FSL K6-1122]|uniref:Thioredoxin domain-containing protein n=1 Tax=Paenibacillus amylolyticus TaxID=1451 RepID=A0ABD8AUG4_PAEAM|nr:MULTISPECIES: hypothetical protein [Paenibacillus]ETT40268.1 hypothetical protein C161_03464 [Paenibacillus sp. FSL R5-192]ETT46840.1 hypothetical protein C170_22379 [Paenibacillus sp. FSL H7-689]OME91770.1 hypothetical protein BK124_27840 [Paenibacillus amylolyticus]OME97930.1 hypothetical protein BK129_30505 [Paenibacillus amylolyticus]
MEKPEFLKKYDLDILKIDDFLPNMPLSDHTNLHDLIEDHLILFLASTHCDLCEQTLEVIDKYTEKNHDLNIVVLLDSDPSSIGMLINHFKERAQFYLVPPHIMNKYLKMRFLPVGFAIDCNMKIVTTHSVQDMNSFQDLIEPLQLEIMR